MGDIQRTSDYGIGDPDPGTFIQCVDGRYPVVHKLWCHSIYGICREVHPTVLIEIPDGTIGLFVSEYLSENRRRNRIIGELSINGRVQFIGLSEIWGSVLLHISNPRDPEATSGWCNTGSINSTGGWVGSSVYTINPGSNIFTRRLGGSFADSTVTWGGSDNSSPAGSPRSTVCHYFVLCRFRDNYFNAGNLSVCGSSTISEILRFIIGGKTDTSL